MRNAKTKFNSPSAGATTPGLVPPRIPVWLMAVVLTLGTIALYWPATRCDFVNFDDEFVVTANVHVQKGLTLENVKWAFFNPVNSIWHPLTVLSHMLDCQLFGLNPWGHHLTSVLFHAINTALVFLLLRRLTGVFWRSVLVAALFGWHPLHVESVAWVSERKDVLSTFFGLLTLIFYVRYAQKRSRANISVWAVESGLWTLNYALALVFFALGLLSKPMLVTLPFVLLLLDYWPLDRFKVQGSRFKVPGLVLEKLPFFVPAAVTSVVTFMVQKQTGVLRSVEILPLGARVGNALISYCRYLGKLFWPTDLAVLYPHPGHWPLEHVLMAGGLLLGITVFLIVKRQQCPFLLMGWLWFVGTLVPVIQLVQTGNHAMADRYTYIPSLGMFILVIWGVNELTRRWRHQVMILSVAGCVVIILCCGLTRRQLGYWQDSEALFRHTLEVTENNYLAHNNLAIALNGKDQTDEAISQYQEALRLVPDFDEAHYNLGNALLKNGQIDEAISQYHKAIRLTPDYVGARYNLGIALDRKGQIDEAIRQYQEAIQLEPDFADAHYNLGNALIKQGQTDEAIRQYREAIRLKPDYAEVHNNLGIAFAGKGRLDEAIGQFQEAVRLKPDYAEAEQNLTRALGMKNASMSRGKSQ